MPDPREKKKKQRATPPDEVQLPFSYDQFSDWYDAYRDKHRIGAVRHGRRAERNL